MKEKYGNLEERRIKKIRDEYISNPYQETDEQEERENNSNIFTKIETDGYFLLII